MAPAIALLNPPLLTFKTYCPWDSPSQWLELMVEVLRAGPLWLDMKFPWWETLVFGPFNDPAKSPLYLPYSLSLFLLFQFFSSLFPKVSDQSHSVKSLLLLLIKISSCISNFVLGFASQHTKLTWQERL